ncbi:MAG: glutamate racemase [Alphaproteobacteria bacterium]
MNIGLFDSGLGGLIITKSIIETMPEYNFSYIGDTAHVPYGSRSKETIYNFTKNCVDYLFKNQNCELIIIACNTASIAALRRLQQEYLKENFPNRKILGVVIPTIETVIENNYKSIGLLATNGTVASDVFGQELRKLNKDIKLYSTPAPLLVPLIENNGDKYALPIIQDYIRTFKDKDIEAIILGCTHYPHYKDIIKKEAEFILQRKIDIISQDEIIPQKIITYLQNHPEIEANLSKNGERFFGITDITESYRQQAYSIFEKTIEIEKVNL